MLLMTVCKTAIFAQGSNIPNNYWLLISKYFLGRGELLFISRLYGARSGGCLVFTFQLWEVLSQSWNDTKDRVWKLKTFSSGANFYGLKDILNAIEIKYTYVYLIRKWCRFNILKVTQNIFNKMWRRHPVALEIGTCRAASSQLKTEAEWWI